MKKLTLALLAGLLAGSIKAQPAIPSPSTGERPQTALRRSDGASTNLPGKTATNAPSASFPGIPPVEPLFLGTLLAVDRQNQSVTIASGPPALTHHSATNVFLLTPQTKLFAGTKPATLDEAVIGRAVRYGLEPKPKNGKPELRVLRLAPRQQPKP